MPLPGAGGVRRATGAAQLLGALLEGELMAALRGAPELAKKGSRCDLGWAGEAARCAASLPRPGEDVRAGEMARGALSPEAPGEGGRLAVSPVGLGLAVPNRIGGGSRFGGD